MITKHFNFTVDSIKNKMSVKQIKKLAYFKN